jgi:hypothetical protein
MTPERADLLRAHELAAALAITDPVYVPIFERLDREASVEPIERAARVAARRQMPMKGEA